MRIEVIKIYQYEELSEEAKEKALEQFYDINIEHEWWDYGYIAEQWKEKGIYWDGKNASFDLGRGSYFCPLGRIEIVDYRLFAKAMGLDLRKKVARDLIENGVGIAEYREKLYAESAYAESETCEAVQEFLRELCEDARISLQKEYEYLTSKEAIENTIIANEYYFKENGIFYY